MHKYDILCSFDEIEIFNLFIQSYGMHNYDILCSFDEIEIFKINATFLIRPEIDPIFYRLK